MKVKIEIPIYEINDTEVPIGTNKALCILSHWNRNNLVILKIGKNTYTVAKRDLNKAIENATNVS